MFKRIILLSILLFCFVFTSSYNFIPKSKQTYYEKNKWDFMDDLFVGDVNNTSSKYDLIPRAIFAAPYVVGLYFFFKESFNGGSLDWELFGGLAVVGVVILPIMYLIYDVADGFVYNTSLDDKIFKSLKIFFKNYDPDMNSALKVNFKKFIPEEFHETFDNMYYEYKEQGDSSLKATLSIIYNIRSKVKYDVKREKYIKPTVIVT